MTREGPRRLAAEAIGTALLVGIGTGTVVASARWGGIPLWAMTMAWFFAVLLPIYLFIRLSGAHLNPAVTLALAWSGRIAWRETGWYVGGQFLGAFAGSAAVWGLLGDFGRLGATVPARGEAFPAFAAEFAFTAGLVAAVFALADQGEGHRRWRLLLPPTAVGFSTYFIGPWTGSSLNPARTLAPALLSGTYGDLWVYLLAVPFAALVVGGLWRPRAVDRLDRGTGRADSSS